MYKNYTRNFQLEIKSLQKLVISNEMPQILIVSPLYTIVIVGKRLDDKLWLYSDILQD
jgi:hypothetical protein